MWVSRSLWLIFRRVLQHMLPLPSCVLLVNQCIQHIPEQVLRRGVWWTRGLQSNQGPYRGVGGGEGVARVRLLGGRGRRGERVRARRRQGLGKRSLPSLSLNFELAF